MIRAALFVIAAVSFTVLALTPVGPASLALAIFGGIPTVALILMDRTPTPPPSSIPVLRAPHSNEGNEMTVPIGSLPDITPEAAAGFDIITLDIARTEYPVTIQAHRLEAADYITNDEETSRAHMAEVNRLRASLNVIQDEISIRRIQANVMSAIASMKEQSA